MLVTVATILGIHLNEGASVSFKAPTSHLAKKKRDVAAARPWCSLAKLSIG